MTDQENPKTGDHVDRSGVYVDEWGNVEILNEGDIFPEDPVIGKTSWKLTHYPFDSQATSKTIAEKYRNEIKNHTEKDR